MNKKKILYRGILSDAIGIQEYINLTDNYEFAQDYGDIVLEYELISDNICEENIKDRYPDVRRYDTYIEKKLLDGYKWKISDKDIYHYRIREGALRLIKITYLQKDLENAVSALTRFNRKYLSLNQTEFSRKTGVPRVKISEYENAAREPSLEKISLLSSLIDIPQELQLHSGKVVFQN